MILSSSPRTSEPPTTTAPLGGSARRISSVLFEESDRRFGSLSPVPSNVEAIEAALLFACGLNTLVAVVGPSGWGKSHLLRSAAYRLDRDREGRTPILSALDWLAYPHAVDPAKPLILDDVQDATRRAKTRLQLRLALERRVRAGRPTLLSFTAPRVSRALVQQLPAHRKWVIAAMAEPAPSERQVIVSQMAKMLGLSLSVGLARLLARRLPGNGRTLAGALQRLQAVGRRWLSDADVLHAAGLLNPCFADDGNWDLKERIVAANLPELQPHWRVEPSSVLAYAMVAIAELPEADVARFLSIRPSAVFQGKVKFESLIEKDRAAAAEFDRYLERIVEVLVRD